MRPEMKPLFEERMRKLLKDEEDFGKFSQIVHTPPRSFIRCNTLKISCDELFERLSKKWMVVRLFEEFPEIMIVEGKLINNVKNEKIINDRINVGLSDNIADQLNSSVAFNCSANSQPTRKNRKIKLVDYINNNLGFAGLEPGELGNAIEHLLGYYYVQEVSSMMSVIALNPSPDEFVFDLCASPGSKTTQIAAMMENKGTIIANDFKLDRIKILNANLERCGVMNCVVTRNDGVGLCNRIVQKGWKFDKILLDVPCSGDGTLRSSPKTFLMWNYDVVKKLSREQKKLIANAIKCLKKEGVLVYSTCTHSPEENEAVVDFALKNFPVSVEEIKLPLICRRGIREWDGSRFSDEVSKCCRIYPQDNDSEGFFVAKLGLMEEVR